MPHPTLEARIRISSLAPFTKYLMSPASIMQKTRWTVLNSNRYIDNWPKGVVLSSDVKRRDVSSGRSLFVNKRLAAVRSFRPGPLECKQTLLQQSLWLERVMSELVLAVWENKSTSVGFLGVCWEYWLKDGLAHSGCK
ncbi:hypothetical protein CEXT_385071 [Caerostris extrusa]|uniref:Uncharacterized protein n=1 Tax=Caerostris extrusa TaxID=172846 RepID=A0AAV4QMQ9_CAEEX|nr:hypothetical protein CEXT_385071 [Caerostris extrusa]